VRGQKTYSIKGFNVASKAKRKKSEKKDFLILFLTQENTFLITPHPNPLPACGERG
jgi:hypothetical protein